MRQDGRLPWVGIDPGAMKQAVSRDFESVARAWLAHWRTGGSERYAAHIIKSEMLSARPTTMPCMSKQSEGEVLLFNFRSYGRGWAAAGFTDTWLRWTMMPEASDGNEKGLYSRVQV